MSQPQPFALAYTQPREAEQPLPFAYDPATQTNLCPDGTPAADSWTILLRTGATSSTAGGKASNDTD